MNGTEFTVGKNSETKCLGEQPQERSIGYGHLPVWEGGQCVTVSLKLRTDNNVNTESGGCQSISGTPLAGKTLKVGTANIVEADGNTKAKINESGYAYSYQRIRVPGTHPTGYSYSRITGASLIFFPLTSDDLGNTVRVKVSFTDDEGNS